MKLAIAFFLTLFPATATELHVTIYDRANLEADVTRSAADTLLRIFRQAGIAISIHTGDPDSTEARFFTYPAPPLPGQATQAACLARREIALTVLDSAAPGTRPAILGVAQPLARVGLNVMVFHDRIRNTAFRQSRPHGLVLGHAIAHEIGHVLLRTNDHADWGIMAGGWGSREFDRMPIGGLLFSRAQSQEMQATLRGEGCPGLSQVAIP